MPTLSEKRTLHYASRFSDHNDFEVGAVNVNTDEVESKLDSVISNTSHSTFALSVGNTISASGSITTATTDFGLASPRVKVNYIGNCTSNSLNIIVEVSQNNVDFYPLHSFVFTQIGINFSCMGQTNFRYLRTKLTDTSGSSNTINLEMVAKSVF